MKALYYISGLALLTIASCTSGLYVGTEYDDLYYQSSDQPVTQVRTRVRQPVAENNLQSGAYYDNIYASDTLVSREYTEAVADDYAEGYNDYNYYDNYSYAGRLNRFHGNYFNPYWRDPFYSSWYPSFGFNNFYGGSPYSYGYYDPFYYDYYSPYYYGGFYNNGYFMNNYYGGLYGMNYYGSWYSPYYYGGYSSYSFNDRNVNYGRRERPSTLSTRWSGGTGSSSPAAASSRRTDIGTGAVSANPGSVTDVASASSRRTVNPAYNPQQAVSGAQRVATQGTAKSGSETVTGTQTRRAVTTRPEYNSVDRTYTPSYSNPRMSTRPSYNNTRVNTNGNSNVNTNTNRSTIQRNNQNSTSSGRSNSSYSSAPVRSGASSGSPGTYSVPSRRSSGSGSYSSGSSSYSSGSNRSSYSSGSSSGSVSRSSGGGSYSSGSSSSGSSSSSSSSGGSRRR